MKKLILLLSILLFIYSCGAKSFPDMSKNNPVQVYSEDIVKNGKIDNNTIKTLLASSGNIEELLKTLYNDNVIIKSYYDDWILIGIPKYSNTDFYQILKDYCAVKTNDNYYTILTDYTGKILTKGFCYSGKIQLKESRHYYASGEKSKKLLYITEDINKLIKKYGISKVQKHSDVCATSCPGKNFPFSEIAGAASSSGFSKPAASTSKPASSKFKQIKVDKWWGTDTTRLLQQIFGTPVDGKVSNQDPAQKKYLLRADAGAWDFTGTGNGSDLIGAMQRYVGEKDDGFMGKKTIMAWQKFLGVKVDGYMGEDTVGALQRWANKQAA